MQLNIKSLCNNNTLYAKFPLLKRNLPTLYSTIEKIESIDTILSYIIFDSARGFQAVSFLLWQIFFQIIFI